MSGNIPPKQQKIVCIKSGNRCALPDCRRELIEPGNDFDNAAIIGVIAHIKGENPGSARYDTNMSDTERNSYPNLLLLCPNCHTKIDNQPNTYTDVMLFQIKKEHEDWIRECTKAEVVNVTFAELNVVTKYLISGQSMPSDDFTVIPPKDKIKKNNLSGSIEALINMGSIQANQVGDYIGKSPDIDFGERLKQGFVMKYEQLKNAEELEGDNLFMALLDFSSGGSNNFKQKAAGLAVLVYLFEKCEVFEK